MSLLFIIKCQQEKYYLGLSNSFVSIFFTHYENHNNISWLNIYKPIQIVHIEHFFNFNKLNNSVIYYMFVYGIENVRGGSYTNINLSNQQYIEITQKIQNCVNLFRF